jgi:hypothetical protein
MVYESVIGAQLITPEEGQRKLSYTNGADRYSSSGFICISMKSIERRFNSLQKENPCMSTLMNFIGAVKGGDFSQQSISRWFGKLVDKDDYDRKDKKRLLVMLNSVTKPLRTTKIEGKPMPVASQIARRVAEHV